MNKNMITPAVMAIFLTAMLLTSVPQQLQAHCQIPCGIYSDNARVVMMLEDVTTLEKSVSMLNELVSKSDVQSRNQFSRWVTNKESHAQKIIETISNYFLTQRVKPSQDDYVERLKAHHAVILNAMKVKQNSSAKYTDALRVSVSALLKYYPNAAKPHQH